MSNDQSSDNTNRLGHLPEIRNLRFLTQGHDNQFTVEFEIYNPRTGSADRLLINRASIGYWDRDSLLMTINTWAPDNMYELALHIWSVVEGHEPPTLLEKEHPASGTYFIGCGEISVDVYFPLWLQVEPCKKKTVRITVVQAQLTGETTESDEHAKSFVSDMTALGNHYACGYFTVALEGYYFKPIQTQIKDNRFLQYVTHMITSGLVKG